MSFFGLFGKKPLSSVIAHILDPNAGYSTQTWAVGNQISRENAERLVESGNIFVVVFYEDGAPKQIICKRGVWDQAKAQFDRIDAKGQTMMQEAIEESLPVIRLEIVSDFIILPKKT